ncbi:MAG: DUF1684 domain-containing protein [Bacteroidia bacterium]
MKNKMLLLVLFAFHLGFSQSKDSLKNSAIEFQNELNRQYFDSLESPLTKEDRRSFKGHEFYPVNLKYCVTAIFKRTPNEKIFGMKTTTERMPTYVKFGEIYFKIDNKKCTLNVYQNVDFVKKAGYENYLFLPFKDLTSGIETYGGGRFIDLRKTDGNKMIVDFNKAYNPYCAYNHAYSCPVPPPENSLNVEIRAGVKLKD